MNVNICHRCCFAILMIVASICGCQRLKERSVVAVELEQQTVVPIAERKSVGVFFVDYHIGREQESVLVNGKKLPIPVDLEPLFLQLRQIRPDRVAVGVGKEPHPELAGRIKSLKAFCEKEQIELDISADELFFIRGGTVDFVSSEKNEKVKNAKVSGTDSSE